MNNYSSQDYQYTDGQIDREREREMMMMDGQKNRY